MRRFVISLFWLVTCAPMFASGLPPHPRVLVNEAELAALRPQLLQRGWKRQIYRSPQGIEISGSAAGTRSNAEWWLQRPIEIPARGGHYHHYFCDDGNRLALPPHPEMIHGPYHCPSCGRQYEGEKFDAAYRRIYHVWLAQAARDLAPVYALEQRPEYAAKAAVGRQLIDVPGYTFRVCGTNRSEAALALWRDYNGRACVEQRIKELKHDLAADGFCRQPFFATESTFLAVLFTFNLLSLYQHQTTPDAPYRQPGTLRVAVFLCGAVLGVLGRDAVVKLSAAWGGLHKHKPLVAASLNWLKCASPKLIPPEDRLAIGGGMI